MMILTNHSHGLSRAAPAARGEEAVSIPELKMIVGKALVLIVKLDAKSQTNENIIVQEDKACAD
jgi:hypothetical protein